MQTEFLLWLQSLSHPILSQLMIFITNLGGETAYLLLIAALYWCWNKQSAFKWMNVLMLSALTNAILKNYFQALRPFQKNPAIVGEYTASATSYSFPSGHSMNAGANLTWAIRLVKHRAFTIAAVVLMLLIGFSRLYLRVHWPQDVLVGLLLGVIIAFGYEYYAQKFPNYLELPALLAAIVVSVWFRDTDSLKLLGTFLGGLSGHWLGEYLFKTSVHTWKQGGYLKYGLGLLVLVSVQLGLKTILPEGMFLYRYALVGFTLTFVWPWTFEKFYRKQ